MVRRKVPRNQTAARKALIRKGITVALVGDLPHFYHSANQYRSLFIVELACFDGPSEVVDAVKEEFGITISRQQSALYDPTKPAGRTLSPKLTAVFHATREAFLKDVATIPIAIQAYRLCRMQFMLEEAMDRGNDVMAHRLLEQAAKKLAACSPTVESTL